MSGCNVFRQYLAIPPPSFLRTIIELYHNIPYRCRTEQNLANLAEPSLLLYILYRFWSLDWFDVLNLLSRCISVAHGCIRASIASVDT